MERNYVSVTLYTDTDYRSKLNLTPHVIQKKTTDDRSLLNQFARMHSRRQQENGNDAPHTPPPQYPLHELAPAF